MLFRWIKLSATRLQAQRLASYSSIWLRGRLSTSEELLVIGCYLMGVCARVCSYQCLSTNTYVSQPRHATFMAYGRKCCCILRKPTPAMLRMHYSS
ncbi:hypothetical protein M441DRAFT_363422 [Trichoderma asperellum CBS 433.97]|uniref:Uncharacterized protein n=1 Tax=Trichoderma asperellum (strain ATCC 204424 / CBS 433.97 / NBRC 101777) TaxID=1042311 RepID=A0A2T3ZE04_TRIA4|nr:hypothetical protein M441DRAFT_363422 [Trichoderma asperellum CBS 433.97]PTB43020.1 hypothetical protein M441DRAFT_363422 [Trichoderma asperellum CBS 433.97]